MLPKNKVTRTITKRTKEILKYLLSLIASVIFLSYLSAFLHWENGLIPKEVLLWPYNMLQSATPLWATILLIIVSDLLLYIYLSQQEKIPLSPPPRNYKTEYFTIDNLKWKTKIYDYGDFEVDQYPICLKHDLPFIFSNNYKYCPEVDKDNCKNKIYINDEFKIYETAKSYIEKQIRNKNKTV